MEVFGSSGTRGVVNDSLTPTFVLQVAQAAGTVWKADRVALARDTRTTGGMLADAAASGLESVGADVDRLGVVPTPGAQRYAGEEGVPLVMITASHNPPEFNGVKLVGTDGIELSIDDLERVEETLLSEAFGRKPWDGTGHDRRVEDAGERYLESLLAAVDCERIAGADLTVAVDPGHGAGSVVTPTFFRELGCSVVTVNAQPDGHFPGRDPEPVPDNLVDLCRLVRSTDADLGVAHDGDADRAVFVDEHGEPINGATSLAAFAASALSAGDAFVTAVNASQRVVDAVRAAGADLELTPIGSSYIVSHIRELREAGRSVPVAGEGNGGIYFPGTVLARDGALVAARFLELVAETPASELIEPHTGYASVRENVEYGSEAERAAMLRAIESYAANADADPTTIDGYRLDFADGWVLARPSGTEPLVRVYAESEDREVAERLAGDLVGRLETARTDA